LARHEEVDVGEVASVRDRASEHVAEDQQEQHALRRSRDQQRWRADELLQGPRGDLS
jgi:hypothetical protein